MKRVATNKNRDEKPTSRALILICILFLIYLSKYNLLQFCLILFNVKIIKIDINNPNIETN